jgi:hypothetical protein
MTADVSMFIDIIGRPLTPFSYADMARRAYCPCKPRHRRGSDKDCSSPLAKIKVVLHAAMQIRRPTPVIFDREEASRRSTHGRNAPKATTGRLNVARRDGPEADFRPAYSITSSAAASSDGGTVRSSNLAVWVLMTSSNLLDCITGKSAGLSPLRMRPA